MRGNYNDMQQRVAIKTAEIGQLQNELAVLDHNQSQLVTALCQVSADNATLHSCIIALEKEVLVLKSAPAPVAGTSIFTPHAAPAPVAPTGPSQPHLPRIPAPPKFSSNTKDLLLESWLQSIGVWFRYYNMTNNHACIISALNLLEGGAALFMDEYSKQASIGNTLGTVTVFLRPLSPCDLVQAESQLAACATPFRPSPLRHKHHGAKNGRLTYAVPIILDVVWRGHSIFYLSSSQDHCAACFTRLLHQWFFSAVSSGLQSNGLGSP
jgi:hypothetical protein